MVGVRFLSGWNKANSSITHLGFKRADFGLFGDLLGRTPWHNILKQRGVQELFDCQGSPPSSSRLVHP